MTTTMRDILWLRPPSPEQHRTMRLRLASWQAEDLEANYLDRALAAYDRGDEAASRLLHAVRLHWRAMAARLRRRSEGDDGAR